MSRLVIFLDDGGVMNDNRRRGPQWRRLLGEFFPPILGGDAEAWAEANRVVASRLWDEYTRTLGSRVDTDYATFWREYQVTWLRGMCELVGVPAPADDESFALAERAAAYVTPRVRSAFPGAVEAIRALHHAGHLLHTASGERSLELDGYLRGMGVHDCFGRLYGPDLVNTLKEGPAYYARLFADAGVAPDEALVVDDSPLAVEWARRTGARAILVADSAAAGTGSSSVIRRLAELPETLRRMG